MKKLFLAYFVVLAIFGFAQKSETLRLKKYKIAQLSDSLRESSGLNFFREKLYTFNDSGNAPDLFEIDKNSGKILKILKTNLINRDWEALTNNGNCFYIGDFGNNLGTRKDLKIYKIPFRNDSLKMDSAKTIRFFYPEQIDFTPKNIRNNFDGEAMIFLDENLHIFTKEWVTDTVSHYLVNPELSENQPAKKLESYDTGFVVTDASFFDNKLYVVGYTKKMKVFLMIFEKDETDNLFFNKPAKKYFLGMAYSIGQVEGIAATENGIYISCENFNIKVKKVPQSLYFVPLKILGKR